MTLAVFFEPHYIENPQTLRETAQNLVEGYFDLRSSSLLATILKVASYATLIIPALILALKAILRCNREMPAATPISNIDPRIQAVIQRTPQFNRYLIGQGTPYEGIELTSTTVRPSNLLLQALFGDESHTTPGSHQLFRYTIPHDVLIRAIREKDPHEVVEVSARGKFAEVHSVSAQRDAEIHDLADLFGPNTYRLSMGEIQRTLDSQQIYVDSLCPLPFYRALKEAFSRDEITILPGNDAAPVKVDDLAPPHCRALIADVRRNLARYGFISLEHANQILNLTLYQLGALIVKTEDCHILLDGDGKIPERNPGDADTIRLINGCGIRGIHATPSPLNQPIVTRAFQAALTAAEKGFLVMPAVGMGVWGGDPNLYWRAFFDAVIEKGAPLERIFVNPGHQPTRTGGPYQGQSGQEFQVILDEYRGEALRTGNVRALANLSKVVNLYLEKTDLVQLTRNLKLSFPDKTVSFFNASDPDVTIGFHVTEYMNNVPHTAPTTEENLGASTTSPLCHERLTGVHLDPRRTLQI